MLASSLAGPEAFVQWAEGPSYLARRPWLMWLSRFLPLVGIFGLVAWSAGWMSPDVCGVIVVAAIVANVLVSVVFTGNIHDIFDSISTRNGEMRHYLALFELIARIPTEAPRLATIQEHAIREHHGALFQLLKLRMIVTK